MKREKSAGGLFGLLARQYLLFTLALLTIAAAVLALWVLYTARLYRVPDWDSLLADPALAEGKWDTLRRHLTPGSGFAVYDAAGLPVAASWAYGDTSAVLPTGGWVVFAGDPGARFYLSLSSGK